MISARPFIAILVFIVLGAGCVSKSGDIEKAKPLAKQDSTPDVKTRPQPNVLAEGFDSSIKYPFVAVIRDGTTYDALREQDSKLPKFDRDFFKSNFIIATFLGERPTGEFTIDITSETDSFTIKEQKPAKDAMVAQMITTPFKLVSIPARADELVRIVLDDAWTAELRLYPVYGSFKSSRRAGPVEELRLKGSVRMIRASQLVTFFFEVQEADHESGPGRGLSGSFSGTVKHGQEIRIRKMITAGLIDLPYDGAQADGILGQDWSELYLKFASLSARSSADYHGEGHIEGLMDFQHDGLRASH